MPNRTMAGRAAIAYYAPAPMTIVAGITSGPYRVVLLLHIFCAIVGLGGVTLNGVYAVASRKMIGHGATAVVRANAKATKIAEVFIYLVPILGFALIGMSERAWRFGQTWIWLATVLYAAALVISLGALLPTARKYEHLVTQIESAGEAPTPIVEATLDRMLKTQAGLGGSLHVLLVVILGLMIWKPGA
jgi:hypothetical protein